MNSILLVLTLAASVEEKSKLSCSKTVPLRYLFHVLPALMKVLRACCRIKLLDFLQNHLCFHTLESAWTYWTSWTYSLPTLPVLENVFKTRHQSFCCCLVAQSCLTLCDPVDSPSHRILQAIILDWVRGNDS